VKCVPPKIAWGHVAFGETKQIEVHILRVDESQLPLFKMVFSSDSSNINVAILISNDEEVCIMVILNTPKEIEEKQHDYNIIGKIDGEIILNIPIIAIFANESK
jgi:hypothetical protein